MLVISFGMCDIGIIMFLLILLGVMVCSVGDSVLCVVYSWLCVWFFIVMFSLIMLLFLVVLVSVCSR